MEIAYDELYKLFKERAEAVSTRVVRAENYAGAAKALADIIAEEKPAVIAAESSRMVVGCVDILEGEKVLEVARNPGHVPEEGKVRLYFTNLRKQSEAAGMGLSEMYGGVAETGSLVGDCTSMENRLVSTLPPVHVVLMPASNIMATPADAVRKFFQGNNRPPGYFSFISGPSRTADIERVLTIGVHGPERLYVILVEDMGGGRNE